MTSLPPECRPQVHGFRRIVYIFLGLLFVGLGVIGAMLPVLPTTPFLLLASYFFVRSSPRLNGWLLRSPLLGPFLRDWYQHLGVRLHVKVSAILLMVAACTASAIWGNLSWPLLAVLLVLATIGVVVVMRLPLIQEAPLETSAAEPKSN